MDVTTLSRVQFGLNISFHYIFPPLSVGLGLILILMEGLYLLTKNPVYERMTKFWVKMFALIFAVGVGTGLVQVFAFGTNWARFSRYVGDVFGSLLGAEGIFAFFLESGFLGVLLFGWERVSKKMHFFSTVMVALGAHFSAIWIVIANSWMQTPAGYKIVGEGEKEHATIQSFWQALHNPSSLDRLTHVILGCWLAGAFLVISVSAFYLIKKQHLEFASRSFKIALTVAAVCVVLQFFSGDSTAKGVAKNQPIKLAAFEGIYKTTTPTGMWLFGNVNPKEKKIVGVQIPGLLSFLVYHNFKEPVPGLDQVPRQLWPSVPFVFQTYHGMVFMWVLMVMGVILGLIAWKRKKLLESKVTLMYLILSVVFPQIANQLGWWSAEVGRQPWVVYGLLKTEDAVSVNIDPSQVMFSLVLFSLIYLMIFVLFLYLLDRKIRHGPPIDEEVHLEEYRNPFESKGTL